MTKTFTIACNGYDVVADWYEGQTTDKILLALIGWTSNRKNYADLLNEIVAKTGMSAIVFDYSGHGDSPLDPMETRPAQHFLEVITVFDWIKQHYSDVQLSVMGTSYGGFMAAQLTKYREFERLILRAPAIYQPKDFYTLWKHIDREWTNKVYRKDKEALATHPLLARAANFRGKTLVVVHELDELVPIETTDAYIKALHTEVYTAKGFTHRAGDASASQLATYQTAIANWLSTN